MFEKRRSRAVEGGELGREDRTRRRFALVGKTTDLVVDELGRRLRGRRIAKRETAELVAESELHDHAACQRGRLR